jgi:hypothetical protein
LRFPWRQENVSQIVLLKINRLKKYWVARTERQQYLLWLACFSPIPRSLYFTD